MVLTELHSTLWQYISKEHMESMADKVISDERWYRFIADVESAFADEVSQLAYEFWNDYGEEE